MANIDFLGFERILDATPPSYDTLFDLGIGGSLQDVHYNTNTPRSGGSQQYIEFRRGTAKRTIPGGNYAHLFCGVGFRKPVLNYTVAGGYRCAFTLFDGLTAQVGWQVLTNGAIAVFRGLLTSSVELGRTAAGVFVIGTGAADFHMIDFEVVLHASAGTITLKYADATVLTLTGQNTAPSGNAFANAYMLAGDNDNEDQFDDLYINDDTGSAPDNTFYGEAFVVESLIPNGNGNSSQWVGSDGNSTDNYLLVDDAHNADTDYVKSGTLNDIDTYGLSNLSNSAGTIVGINHYIIARKDDVATRNIASVLRISGTDYVNATNHNMTGTYVIYADKYLTSPATAVKFTISEVNGMEAGQKVTV